jgi:sirohydrochlorin ferrochelatase
MASNSTAIVLFAHGSSVPEANTSVALLAEEVSREAQRPVLCAFLELAQPDLEAAVERAVGAGARRVIVVPYFLTLGLHAGRDLPRLIEQQRRRFPNVEITAARSLEGSPGLAQLIIQRVRDVLPSEEKPE